jgi:IclR family acetate operon transcriptional repressor
MQHQSLERALKILLAFRTENKELGIVELSQMLNIHRSTVSRITRVLVAYDFLEQNPETKKFSLGQANIQLGNALQRSLRTNLVQIAKPYVDDLRNRFEETTIIETLVGRNWVMVYVAEGSRPIRLVAEMGERMPIHAAAGGKAFLAFSSPEVRSILLKGGLQRLTKNTIVDHKKLDRQLEEIRRHGISFDRGEYGDHIYALGAPVFDYRNRTVAGIVIAGQPERITAATHSPMISALKETAKKISHRLGYKGA